MRHQNRVKHLNRFYSHRKAMLSNMLQSLIKYERIRTTHARAKVLRQIAEHCITLAKENTLHTRRIVMKLLKDRILLTKLFTNIAPRYSKRSGGYTRILRLGTRPGDNSQMCFIELVEEKIEQQSKEPTSAIKSAIKKVTKKEVKKEDKKKTSKKEK